MKKMLCTILAVLLTVGMISGCGKTSEVLPSSSAASGAVPMEVKYPVEGGGTLSMWMGFPANAAKYFQSYAENETIQQFQKEIGINIEFVHPVTGQEKENFNMLAVSGKLPDIMAEGKYAGGAAAGVKDGIFADLTKLVPQYAPDYYKLLQQDELFRKLATGSNGEIYALYNYKNSEGQPFYHRGQIRTDWLKEFGMEIPTTLDEYAAYFEKLLKSNKGIKAPFCLHKSGIEGQILGAFGIGQSGTGAGDRLYQVNGKVKHIYTSPEFKDYLILMRDWYKKGYILKDFPTANYETTFTKGEVGLTFANSVTIYPASKSLGFESSSLPYPRLKKGDKYHVAMFYYPQNGGETVINAKADIKKALMFLNYGYTEKGANTRNYGEEGKAWKMVDGKPKYTDYVLNNPKYNITDVEYTVRAHQVWASRRFSDGDSMACNQKDPANWEYRSKWNDDKTADSEYIFPSVSMFITKEEAAESAKIMTDVNTYAEEMILKYITGVADLSKFETEFVKNVEKLNISRAIEISQKGYDAFKAK